MEAIKHLTLKWQAPRAQWGVIFVIAAVMTNLGYGSNLLLALQCEQYYFEYLLFFTLVYGAKILSDRFMIAEDKRLLWKVSLQAGALISITFFGILWAYNVLTNCPFDPIQFLTSRVPLILVLSGLYQYRRFNQRDSESASPTVMLKALNNGLLRVNKNEIASARLESGLLKVYMTNGDIHLIDQSLKRLYEQLDDEALFYRLNRTTLVQRDQVNGFTTNHRHQLIVTLKTGEDVLVNKNKTSAFKNWLS